MPDPPIIPSTALAISRHSNERASTSTQRPPGSTAILEVGHTPNKNACRSWRPAGTPTRAMAAEASPGVTENELSLLWSAANKDALRHFACRQMVLLLAGNQRFTERMGRQLAHDLRCDVSERNEFARRRKPLDRVAMTDRALEGRQELGGQT